MEDKEVINGTAKVTHQEQQDKLYKINLKKLTNQPLVILTQLLVHLDHLLILNLLKEFPVSINMVGMM